MVVFFYPRLWWLFVVAGVLLAVSGLLVISGCNSFSESDPDPVGTGGTGVVRGRITSLDKDEATTKVGGHLINVSRATILKNGEEAGMDDLRLGVDVYVEANHHPGEEYDTATKVTLHGNLYGVPYGVAGEQCCRFGAWNHQTALRSRSYGRIYRL